MLIKGATGVTYTSRDDSNKHQIPVIDVELYPPKAVETAVFKRYKVESLDDIKCC